jgi:hypothetical protein
MTALYDEQFELLFKRSQKGGNLIEPLLVESMGNVKLFVKFDTKYFKKNEGVSIS